MIGLTTYGNLIFPSCSHISTTIWWHHLNFNKMPGENTWRELNKAAACSFEQIQEVAPFKTAAVRSLASYLTNHSRKMNMLANCWRSKNKHSPMDSNTWTHHCWPTRKKWNSSALCEDWMPSRGLTKSNGWLGWILKKIKGIYSVRTFWWRWCQIHIFAYSFHVVWL